MIRCVARNDVQIRIRLPIWVVRAHMLRERAATREALLAPGHIAGIRAQVCVRAPVPRERGRVAERRVAAGILALVGLLARVCAEVDV